MLSMVTRQLDLERLANSLERFWIPGCVKTRFRYFSEKSIDSTKSHADGCWISSQILGTDEKSTI